MILIENWEHARNGIFWFLWLNRWVCVLRAEQVQQDQKEVTDWGHDLFAKLKELRSESIDKNEEFGFLSILKPKSIDLEQVC